MVADPQNDLNAEINRSVDEGFNNVMALEQSELLEDYSQTDGGIIGSTPISFIEDTSTKYQPRTMKNAAADATIAIAIDFSSAGEKLTKSSVESQGKVYIPIDIKTNFEITDDIVNDVVDKLNSVIKLPESYYEDLSKLPWYQRELIEAGGIKSAKVNFDNLDQSGSNWLEASALRSNIRVFVEELRIAESSIERVLTGQNAKDALKLIPKVKEYRKLNTQRIMPERGPDDTKRYAQLSREIHDEVVRLVNAEYGNIATSFYSGVHERDMPSNKITLNMAGNGIYTMKGKYTQEQLDEYVYQLLSAVINSENLKNKIISIRSGGQTGIDEAGAKAGMRLGIPTTILAPKGWTFRPINGKDKSSESEFKARFNIGNTINEPVMESKTNTIVEKASTPYNRKKVGADTETLYIFTDNTDRTSGSTANVTGWYADKYGKGLSFGTVNNPTTAVIRGLDNAYPVSTMKWFYKNHNVSVNEARWTDNDFEEFKAVIDDEFATIQEAISTKGYKKVVIPSGDGFFNSKIANITLERTPLLYRYLAKKLQELRDGKVANEPTSDYNNTTEYPDDAMKTCKGK